MITSTQLIALLEQFVENIRKYPSLSSLLVGGYKNRGKMDLIKQAIVNLKSPLENLVSTQSILGTDTTTEIFIQDIETCLANHELLIHLANLWEPILNKLLNVCDNKVSNLLENSEPWANNYKKVEFSQLESWFNQIMQIKEAFSSFVAQPENTPVQNAPLPEQPAKTPALLFTTQDPTAPAFTPEELWNVKLLAQIPIAQIYQFLHHAQNDQIRQQYKKIIKNNPCLDYYYNEWAASMHSNVAALIALTSGKINGANRMDTFIRFTENGMELVSLALSNSAVGATAGTVIGVIGLVIAFGLDTINQRSIKYDAEKVTRLFNKIIDLRRFIDDMAVLSTLSHSEAIENTHATPITDSVYQKITAAVNAFMPNTILSPADCLITAHIAQVITFLSSETVQVNPNVEIWFPLLLQHLNLFLKTQAQGTNVFEFPYLFVSVPEIKKIEPPAILRGPNP